MDRELFGLRVGPVLCFVDQRDKAVASPVNGVDVARLFEGDDVSIEL